MGRIILARHGQDEDNARQILNGRRDSPLTELGRDQAYQLASNLKDKEGLNIGHIFSSPFQRAVKTAEICSQVLGVPHTILDCLIERSHGILEGRPYSDIPLLAKEYKVAYGFTYVIEVEGGEGYPELCERAGNALTEIRTEIQELKIFNDSLVISHGAISRAMMIAHQGLTHLEIFNAPSFSNCEFRVLK